MCDSSMYNHLLENPIIAALKNEADLFEILKTDVKVVFVLHASILTVKDISETIKAHGKLGFIHVGLVKGLSDDETGVRFIKKETAFSGIISTKWSTVMSAKKYHLCTIYRIFMVDSMALESLKNHTKTKQPDFFEILPNANGKVIKLVKAHICRPLIVSGLILDKEDAVHALKHNVIAVSSTNKAVWYL